jgi:hypothetical protein
MAALYLSLNCPELLSNSALKKHPKPAGNSPELRIQKAPLESTLEKCQLHHHQR